jgi:putative RecB family exonuclease
MAFPLPASLSPSKVASFKDCALAFRFSAIDRIPQPPTVWTATGTLVHRALELLFANEPSERTLDAALHYLQVATPEVLLSDEYVDLSFDSPEDEEAFLVKAEELIHKYFLLEDPTTIKPIGLELKLEVQLGSLKLRGIIDRLEEDAEGNLIVTDYKTGKVPRVNHEGAKLGGVHFYAFLCEQIYGRRPSQVQLLYLSEPMRIITEPTDLSIKGLQTRTSAIWSAVEKACEREDFRPKPSRLCDWCSYQAWCPAFGGDPNAAPRREDTIDLRAAAPIISATLATPAPTSTIHAAIQATEQDLEHAQPDLGVVVDDSVVDDSVLDVADDHVLTPTN